MSCEKCEIVQTKTSYQYYQMWKRYQNTSFYVIGKITDQLSQNKLCACFIFWQSLAKITAFEGLLYSSLTKINGHSHPELTCFVYDCYDVHLRSGVSENNKSKIWCLFCTDDNVSTILSMYADWPCIVRQRQIEGQILYFLDQDKLYSSKNQDQWMPITS